LAFLMKFMVKYVGTCRWKTISTSVSGTLLSLLAGIESFAQVNARYDWPATTKDDLYHGPNVDDLAQSQFVVDWARGLKQSREFMYTKSSHVSKKPCVHVYPDNVKVTFTSESPTLAQIQTFQNEWVVGGGSTPLDFVHVEKIPWNTVHVYICCHAARDKRCGVIGSALLNAFDTLLKTPSPGLKTTLGDLHVEVFGSSHVGGHKFAGNVIVYRPEWKQGVSYGRILPRDVMSILRSTVAEGRIIARHWRGGVPTGDWDPTERITGEEAERRSNQGCSCMQDPIET
jgi:(2Fe-2S) ferredoxin